jgi:hypothetical protein
MRATARRLLGVVFAIVLLTTQSAVVVGAEAMSGQTFEAWYDPLGAEPVTDYCARSGITDIARSIGQILAYTNGGGAHDCVGSGNTMPTGWLGVSVEGYRNGVFCGQSSVYTNTQPAWNWMLWINVCSNPSGLQNFQTRSLIFPYDGEDYHTHVGPMSPALPY